MQVDFSFPCGGEWLSMKRQRRVKCCWDVAMNWVPFMSKWFSIERILILANTWLMLVDFVYPVNMWSALF